MSILNISISKGQNQEAKTSDATKLNNNLGCEIYTFRHQVNHNKSCCLIDIEVFCKNKKNEENFLYQCAFASVVFKNQYSSDSVLSHVGLDGKLQMCLDPGEYNITIQFVGFHHLALQNILMKANDHLELQAALETVSSDKHGVHVMDLSTLPCTHSYDHQLKEEVYMFAEEEPIFGDDPNAFSQFVLKDLKGLDPYMYKGQSVVLLSFVVDVDGQLKHIAIEHPFKSVGHSLIEKRAIETVSKMPPWKTGKCDGKTVPVKIVCPLVLTK